MTKVLLAAPLAALLAILYHSSTHVVAVEARWVVVTPVVSITNCNEARVFLDAHNSARAEAGVDPLTWAFHLSNVATRFLRVHRGRCNFVDTSTTEFGSNQLWDRGSTMSPQDVMDYWVAQKKHYNQADNSCEANEECEAYKQMVWRGTLRLGCAHGRCNKNNGTLTICLYSPRANLGVPSLG